LLDDIHIIDDFYENPEVLRKLAIKAIYKNYGEQQNYPGHESVKAYYTHDIVTKFEELLGQHIDYDPGKYVFGKFRYSVKNDLAKTKIHLDWPVHWTGIVYLSEDRYNIGGLGIYQHLETGITRLQQSQDFYQEYGCKSIEEFDARYIYPNSSNMEKWSLIEEIPIKFNRLILFPGSEYFHAITEQFGTTIEDARLTQNFFFSIQGNNVC